MILGRIIRKIRGWLISRWLPGLASAALDAEIQRMRHELDACHKSLRRGEREKEKREAYIRGIERALRARPVTVNIKGASHGEG